MKITFRFFGPPPNNKTPMEVTLPLARSIEASQDTILFVEQMINVLIQGRLHIEVTDGNR